jgi:hypothetical protein
MKLTQDLFSQIAQPTGILAFQPENITSVSTSAIVPGEFESRALMVSDLQSSFSYQSTHQLNSLTFFPHQVNIPSVPSLRYVAILAALYAKSSPGVSGKATVIDLVGDGDGSSSSSSEDEKRRDDFDGEDVLMGES